jgi:hypothetical protein
MGISGPLVELDFKLLLPLFQMALVQASLNINRMEETEAVSTMEGIQIIATD